VSNAKLSGIGIKFLNENPLLAVPPMLSIPNQLEGAYLGQDVILECHTEAYPASINYWTTERGDMIISGKRCHCKFVKSNIAFILFLLPLSMASLHL